MRGYIAPAPEILVCPDCEWEFDYLDTITNRRTSEVYRLYICHNEDCNDYGRIWNDRGGQIKMGDPSGLY